MDWEAIKAEIHRRGSSFADLARDCGLTATVFSQVKRKHNKRAEASIAAFIERKPEELWPERYRKKPRIISNSYRRFLASGNSDAAGRNAAVVNEKQKAAG